MEFLESIADFFSNIFYKCRETAGKTWSGITNFIKTRVITGKKIRGFHIRDLNIYKRFREFLVHIYLKRTVSFEKTGTVITWQPLPYIILKLTAALIASYLFFSLFPYLSKYLLQGILFFRLHEIYNFDLPSTTFLDNLAKIILLIVIGYIGIFYLKHQFQALLSSLAISACDRRLYYIKNLFLLKELYIFSIPEIDHVVLKQNILTRLLGIGTLLFQKKSGEQVRIASIKNASYVFSHLTALIGDKPAEKESITSGKMTQQ